MPGADRDDSSHTLARVWRAVAFNSLARGPFGSGSLFPLSACIFFSVTIALPVGLPTRLHGFLDPPFGKRHRVVPPTFHKIRVCHAISFRRLGNFSNKVLISREYLVPHFKLTFCRIRLVLLRFQKMCHGVFIKILRATPPQKDPVIYPGMIP